jgi:hypothetical protein
MEGTLIPVAVLKRGGWHYDRIRFRGRIYIFDEVKRINRVFVGEPLNFLQDMTWMWRHRLFGQVRTFVATAFILKLYWIGRIDFRDWYLSFQTRDELSDTSPAARTWDVSRPIR